MRDRIVGEVFPLGGRWYQCRVERGVGSCAGCAFNCLHSCYPFPELGECTDIRADGQGVIFVEIEKP